MGRQRRGAISGQSERNPLEPCEERGRTERNAARPRRRKPSGGEGAGDGVGGELTGARASRRPGGWR